jgi:hypothetical protein
VPHPFTFNDLQDSLTPWFDGRISSDAHVAQVVLIKYDVRSRTRMKLYLTAGHGLIVKHEKNDANQISTPLNKFASALRAISVGAPRIATPNSSTDEI